MHGITDKLAPLSLDVPSFYPAATPTRAADVAAGLETDRRLARKADRRLYLNALRIANAARALEELPAPGVTLHCVMRGNYNAWDLVPAMLELMKPRTVAELNIATLGFNQQNADQLIALLDQGRITRATFICSHFYKSNEGDLVNDLFGNLEQRGHRAAALRCHAKIILAQSTGRRPLYLVIESSANLRSCRNIEQFTLTHDRELLEFHRAWQLELLDQAAEHARNHPEPHQGRPPEHRQP